MYRAFRNILMLVVVALLVLWLVGRTEIIPPFKNPFAAKPVVIDRTPLLVKNIKDIAQLMTIEYHDEVVVDSTRNNARILPLPPFIFSSNASLVLIVKGRLMAGLDLQRLDSSHFSGNIDSISIQLPRAKLLDVIVNPTDVETFLERGTWNSEAFAALKQKAAAQIIRNATAQGVLLRADEKARNLVIQLMLNAGYKKVTVIRN
jgi:hypothetical protein